MKKLKFCPKCKTYETPENGKCPHCKTQLTKKIRFDWFDKIIIILFGFVVLAIVLGQSGYFGELKIDLDKIPISIVEPSLYDQCVTKYDEFEALKKHLGIVKIGEFPENMSISDYNLYNDLEEEFEEMDCNLVLYPEDYGYTP